MSPSCTASPTWHSTFHTVPVMWASTSGTRTYLSSRRWTAWHHSRRDGCARPADRAGHRPRRRRGSWTPPCAALRAALRAVRVEIAPPSGGPGGRGRDATLAARRLLDAVLVPAPPVVVLCPGDLGAGAARARRAGRRGAPRRVRRRARPARARGRARAGGRARRAWPSPAWPGPRAPGGGRGPLPRRSRCAGSALPALVPVRRRRGAGARAGRRRAARRPAGRGGRRWTCRRPRAAACPPRRARWPTSARPRCAAAERRARPPGRRSRRGARGRVTDG